MSDITGSTLNGVKSLFLMKNWVLRIVARVRSSSFIVLRILLKGFEDLYSMNFSYKFEN